MAQPKIQRWTIHWTDSAFKNSRGKYVLWADVAPYIKEARSTVRAKRPMQQRKVESERSCDNCLAQIDSSVDCSKCRGLRMWRSQSTVA